MKRTIEIVDVEPAATEKYGFNMSRMVEADDPSEQPKKKRGGGRPSQNTGLFPANVYTDIVTADSKAAKKRQETFEAKIEQGYTAQVRLIAGIIQQSDMLMGEISSELDQYKRKPGYGGRGRSMAISNLQNTQVGLLNTKLAAVRELNSMRSNINSLVMKDRAMTKDDGQDQGDKAIMDAYNALVNASKYNLPQLQPPLHPSSLNTGVNLQGAQIATNVVGAAAPIVTSEPGAAPAMPVAPITTFGAGNPIQQRMVLEKNPNIQTVVVYNQNTGSKRFEVVDVTTGQSIPNVQRPGAFLLDDMKPDFRNGVATNSNANQSFPMVIEGTRAVDEL